ncbi:MAG: hypothetical protein R3F11_27890 [Verrucomicrobiales bacterium]
MLTGEPPLGDDALQAGSLEELRRIREDDPPRPSARLGCRARRATPMPTNSIDRFERLLGSGKGATNPPPPCARTSNASSTASTRRPPALRRPIAPPSSCAGTAPPPPPPPSPPPSPPPPPSATSARREARPARNPRDLQPRRRRSRLRRSRRRAHRSRHRPPRPRAALRPGQRRRRLPPPHGDTDGPAAIPAAPPAVHGETIFHVQFIGDGSRLLTGSTRDGTARLWRWESGSAAPEREFRLPDLVALTASAGGSVIAGGSLAGRVQAWAVAGGQPLWATPARGADGGRMVRGCALSPDGSRLFTAGHDGTLRAWQVGGAEIWRQSRASRCHNVALSADGAMVAGCFDDGTLLICAAGGGAPLGEATLPGPLLAAEFLADGRILAAAGLSAAQVFFPDGRPDGAAMPHGARIYGASASPGGDRIVLEGDDGRAGLWAGGRLLGTEAFPGAIYAGAVSPGGELAAPAPANPMPALGPSRAAVTGKARGPGFVRGSVHGLAWYPGDAILRWRPGRSAPRSSRRNPVAPPRRTR